MEPYMQFLLLCAATAACSMTVAKMKIAQPLHDLATKMGQVWLQDLLTCPWCLSFWFATLWVLLTDAGGGVLGTIFLIPAVMSGAVLIGGAMLRIMFMHEKEVYGLRERLREANENLYNEEHLRKEEARDRERAEDSNQTLRETNNRLMETNNRLYNENNKLRAMVYASEQRKAIGEPRFFGESPRGDTFTSTPEIVPPGYVTRPPANGFTPPRPMPPAQRPVETIPVPETSEVIWPDNPTEAGAP